jgi:hypothetical protein
MDEQGEGKPTALPVEQDLYGISSKITNPILLTNDAII